LCVKPVQRITTSVTILVPFFNWISSPLPNDSISVRCTVTLPLWNVFQKSGTLARPSPELHQKTLWDRLDKCHLQEKRILSGAYPYPWGTGLSF
jgi:hypothetical protein